MTAGSSAVVDESAESDERLDEEGEPASEKVEDEVADWLL